MKTCAKCKAEKPKTDFSKQKKCSDGLQHNCKACFADYYAANRERFAAARSAYYSSNREHIASAVAVYRASNQERIAAYRAANRERILAEKAAYYQANRERLLAEKAVYRAANRERDAAKSAAYRSKNRERCAAQRRAYRAANPEKVAESNRNRRAIKRNADGRHTAADVRRIFEHQQGLCANCLCKLFKSGKKKFHVDHIMPLARGGSNDRLNLQCLCPQCNLSKNAKDPIAWAREQGRLL
jgi:5-methylcytosine-specific restriction endonuclease McrA